MHTLFSIYIYKSFAWKYESEHEDETHQKNDLDWTILEIKKNGKTKI